MFVNEVIIATLEKGEKKSLDELYNFALMVFTSKLFELGFFVDLNGATNVEKQKEAFKMTRALFPHHIGHFIGLDVHDTLGLDFMQQPLKPNQVISIEPGLYIPDNEKYPEKYRGIGVRIEDNILITQNGAENLTSLVPKRIDKLELILNME